MKLQELLDNGFYKVGNNYSLTLTYAIFFNPETKETHEELAVDLDYGDASRDNIEIDECPINEEVAEIYQTYKRHQHHEYTTGEVVKIVRGRKYKGEVKEVVKTFIWQPSYAWSEYQNILYLVFADGTKVNSHNCDLYEGSEA